MDKLREAVAKFIEEWRPVDGYYRQIPHRAFHQLSEALRDASAEGCTATDEPLFCKNNCPDYGGDKCGECGYLASISPMSHPASPPNDGEPKL
jgi:hypothetical protein